MNDERNLSCWEHFRHGADVGIRGIGSTLEQAFEQAGMALMAVTAAPSTIRPAMSVEIRCPRAEPEFLFVDWINALIFEMATRSMLFSRFRVELSAGSLAATAWGEVVDIGRHHPAVEPKGATFTELRVGRRADGAWVAQCVVDV